MNSRMLEAAAVSPGWLTIAAVGVAVVAYFLGCFNGAVVVSRYILRDDIREHGSGNAGLSNFYRVFGGPLTVVVILSDVVKAVVAVMFAMFIAEHISPELIVLSKYWAGAFCMIGHMFPCTFQFRGGKGVLSGSAVAVMIGIGGGGVVPSWLIPVVAWGGFIVLVAATRYVSLGSCWGGASFILMSWIVFQDPLILLLAAIMGGLLLWTHRGNMVRIAKGTERRFTRHKKVPAADIAPETEPSKKAAPAAAEAVPAAGLAEEPVTEEEGAAPAAGPSGEPAPAEEEAAAGEPEEAVPSEETAAQAEGAADPGAAGSAPKAKRKRKKG